MKASYIITISLLNLFQGLSVSVKAQQLQFCEKVESNGGCTRGGTLFKLPAKSVASIDVLVKSPITIAEGTASLDLFYVEPDGKEVFENTIKIAVGQGWLWFKQSMVFRRPGDYTVYAYDVNGRLLGAGEVTLESFR